MCHKPIYISVFQPKRFDRLNIKNQIHAAWEVMELSFNHPFCPHCLEHILKNPYSIIDQLKRMDKFIHETGWVYYCYSCRSSYLFNELELE